MIHVHTHAFCCVGFLLRIFTQHLCLHRPRSRESLHHCLSLEFDERFRKEGVVHTARTFPRLCPVLDFQAQQLKPVYISLYPVCPRIYIILKIFEQFPRYAIQLLITKNLCEVFSKVFFLFLYLQLNRLTFQHDFNFYSRHPRIRRRHVA